MEMFIFIVCLLFVQFTNECDKLLVKIDPLRHNTIRQVKKVHLES